MFKRFLFLSITIFVLGMLSGCMAVIRSKPTPSLFLKLEITSTQPLSGQFTVSNLSSQYLQNCMLYWASATDDQSPLDPEPVMHDPFFYHLWPHLPFELAGHETRVISAEHKGNALPTGDLTTHYEIGCSTSNGNRASSDQGQQLVTIGP